MDFFNFAKRHFREMNDYIRLSATLNIKPETFYQLLKQFYLDCCKSINDTRTDMKMVVH